VDAAVGALFPPPLLLLLLPGLLQALHASSMANNEIFNQEDERSARSLIAWLEPQKKSTCNESLPNGHQSCREVKVPDALRRKSLVALFIPQTIRPDNPP
jgi:hypothetical protein